MFSLHPLPVKTVKRFAFRRISSPPCCRNGRHHPKVLCLNDCVFTRIPLIFTEGKQGSKYHTTHREGPGAKIWILDHVPENMEGVFLMWNTTIRKPKMATCYGMVSEASQILRPPTAEFL